MDATHSVINQKAACRWETEMDALLSELDDAIDDVEHGRVLSEDELWKDIDAI